MTGRELPASRRGTRPALGSLNGLRLVVAAWIFLFHWRGALASPLGALSWHGAGALVERVCQAGFVGVSGLFVLSGFVLAYSHPVPLTDRARARFWVARLARLYPGHLLALVFISPLLAVHAWRHEPLPSVGDLASYVTLANAWIPAKTFAVQEPGWATSAVVFQAIAFPFLVSWLSPRSARGLLAAMAGLWLLGLVGPAVMVQAGVPDSDGSFWALAVRYDPLLRVAEFGSGVALGLWWTRSRVALPAVVTVAALAAWVALALVPVPRMLLHNGLLTPVIALALIGLAGGRGLVPRLFAWRPVAFLGQAGFGIFILQKAVALLVEAGEKLCGAPFDRVTACALTWSITLLAASASLVLVERPAKRAIVALFDRRPPSVGTVLAASELRAQTPATLRRERLRTSVGKADVSSPADARRARLKNG